MKQSGEIMYVILLVWLTLSMPASSFRAHPTSEFGSAEAGFLCEPQDKQDERQWKAGTYRGITVGKTTATELFQKWGKPKDIGHWDWDNPKKPKFRLYHFDSQEELPDRFDSQESLPGRIMVEVEMKTGKVTWIQIPLYGLPVSKAIALFGKDYIETRYETCKCTPDDESPMFESPDGSSLYIEYRSRGIAMVVNDRQMITSIEFIGKPIGFKSAKECEKIPECRPMRKV